MKTLERAVWADLLERGAAARVQRDRYVRGSAMWHEFDGKAAAFDDLARIIKECGWFPLEMAYS